MRIILDGRKTKKCLGLYYNNEAFVNKTGLNKRTILHELYHHLIEKNNIELKLRTEEKEAKTYAKEFLISK